MIFSETDLLKAAFNPILKEIKVSQALILIDIQNDYFPGGKMELVGSEAAAACAARLLSSFRQSGKPVIHVQHIATNPASSFFLPGTSGTDIHGSVTPLSGELLITKHFPNSFRETNLLNHLQALGVKNILFCGMMTSMCVDATVRAAFDLGFACTVATDACATKDLVFNGTTIQAQQVHGSFLAALGAVYAQLKKTEEIV